MQNKMGGSGSQAIHIGMKVGYGNGISRLWPLHSCLHEDGVPLSGYLLCCDIRRTQKTLCRSSDMRIVRLLAAIITFLIAAGPNTASSQSSRRPFTVADDIGLALFHEDDRPVRFSPDGKYVAVYYERGRLDLNRPEDSLRFYRTQDIEALLRFPGQRHPRVPVWIVTRATAKVGPIISDWRWLSDSSGVAFLELTDRGNQRLQLADLGSRTVVPLTPKLETVKTFDIRDRSHYVYVIADLSDLRNRRAEREAERQGAAILLTGRDLDELLQPDNDNLLRAKLQPRSRLWAVDGGKPFEILHDGTQFADAGSGDAMLALSPDGKQIVTALRVPRVPQTWTTLYWPSSKAAQSWIRAGGSVNQYVLINLSSGSLEPLTDAPTGSWWWQEESPRWSPDGRRILLPNTFLQSKNGVPTRACGAVVNLSTKNTICITPPNQNIGSFSDGAVRNSLEVTVRQGLNDRPLLVAADKQESLVIWDPNPQLGNLELGQANPYMWKDEEGREWKGGLYKPADYTAGRRYPLVVQTHGFVESEFIPSGHRADTGYAARELAAAGIIVLQVSEEPGHCSVGWVNPTADSCAVSGYESAVSRLVSDGLVDPSKVGIMGFSATCSSVMELLTIGTLHVKAAVLNDGSTHGYLHYLTGGAEEAGELEIMMGARPFGAGLQQWLKRSPDFNLDKVDLPIFLVSGGPTRLLQWLWEPYEELRYLHKPVDFIMLNTDEHVLTNPQARMVSQGGSVDWFRFWLQDYEDPAPAKSDQYERWQKLRRLQEENQRRAIGLPERPQ